LLSASRFGENNPKTGETSEIKNPVENLFMNIFLKIKKITELLNVRFLLFYLTIRPVIADC
jgi:hypothetical protein